MKKHQQEGQSTIEFIFVFAFGVSIIFLIFNSAINYATGYLVHYATFMASRTYLTYESHLETTSASLQGADQKAIDTFNRYRLSIFKVPASAFHVNPPNSSGGANYLTVGTTTYWDQRIDVMGKITGQTKLELASESFLGKEPTRAECYRRTCMALANQQSCDGLDITLFDDGC